MSDNVIDIPVKYNRPRVITAREIWSSPQPSDLMAWEVCHYIHERDGFTCQGCPAWLDDPHHGKVKLGCRMLAEEACRVVMAVQRREESEVASRSQGKG